jgi:hypothetical protein
VPARAASPAALTWEQTRTIRQYPLACLMYVHYNHHLYGAVSTAGQGYTFFLNQYDDYFLDGLTVNWIGSGSCVRQQNNDIVCTGDVTDLEISYFYSFIPTTRGKYVIYEPGGFHETPVLFRLIVDYSQVDLEFYSASQPLHGDTKGKLEWTVPDMTGNFVPRVTFIDPRAMNFFIPLISEN